MELTNNQIYNLAIEIQKNFQDNSQKLPVKINFYLQKNKNVLLELARDIENARAEIVNNYGNYNEETDVYVIPPEKMEIATKELEDLFSLKQDVQIYVVNIDDFPNDLSFTQAQMEAIMFMIN